MNPVHALDAWSRVALLLTLVAASPVARVPKAKVDSPDPMLHIVQDGKRARAKGKETMARDAFIYWAERVAARVRRRAVTTR
jgi:hypothetical protein